VGSQHYESLQHPVEIGRRSWALKRNWPIGLTYVIAAHAQLGEFDEVRAARADLKALDPSLSLVKAAVQRLYRDQAGINHLLDGLRMARFE
jgi:hypothetical protein